MYIFMYIYIYIYTDIYIYIYISLIKLLKKIKIFVTLNKLCFFYSYISSYTTLIFRLLQKFLRIVVNKECKTNSEVELLHDEKTKIFF